MLKIIVIRHAQTGAERAKITLGRLNWQLSLEGINAATRKAKELSKHYKTCDYIFTSPLERAVQTAGIILEEFKLDDKKFIIDERLTERDFGELSGLTYEEFEAKFPTIAKMNSKEFQANLPSGETINNVTDRISDFIKTLKSKYFSSDQIIIITHTGVIRIMKRLLNAQTDHESRSSDPENLDVFEFEVN